jgi:hypothetical protein
MGTLSVLIHFGLGPESQSALRVAALMGVDLVDVEQMRIQILFFFEIGAAFKTHKSARGMTERVDGVLSFHRRVNGRGVIVIAVAVREVVAVRSADADKVVHRVVLWIVQWSVGGVVLAVMTTEGTECGIRETTEFALKRAGLSVVVGRRGVIWKVDRGFTVDDWWMGWDWLIGCIWWIGMTWTEGTIHSLYGLDLGLRFGENALLAFVIGVHVKAVEGGAVVIEHAIDFMTHLLSESVGFVCGLHDLVRDRFDLLLEVLAFAVHLILLCFQDINRRVVCHGERK